MAVRFGISVSSVVKWHQRFRQTGTVAPDKMGGHRKRVLAPHRDFIIAQINRTPHLTVRGLQAILAKRGIVVSHHAVWTFLHREGLSFKKILFGLEQGRADVARKRRRWKSFMGQLDPRYLVFIDETWIKANMAPLRGWSKKDERLRGFAPHGHWSTIVVPAAIFT